MDQRNIEEFAEKHVFEQNVPANIKGKTKNCIIGILTHDAYNNPEYVLNAINYSPKIITKTFLLQL